MSNRLTQADATPPIKPLEVYHADRDKMVTRSPDDQRKGRALMRMVEMATLVKAVALARIADGEHYLDFGAASFKEFAEAQLPFGYRQAKKYLKIGRKFEPLLPGFQADEGNSNSLLPGEVADSDELEAVGSIPIDRLRKLTDLDDAHFEDVVRTGKMVMPDGETSYSLEELKNMKSRQYAELMEQARMDKQAYQARIQQLEEETKKLQSERESDAERMEEAEKRLDQARSLEMRFGPVQRTYEAREQALEQADGLLRELRACLVPLEMDADDAQGLQNKLSELLRELYAIWVDTRLNSSRALEQAEDTIEIEAIDRITDAAYDKVFGPEAGGPGGEGTPPEPEQPIEVHHEETGEVMQAPPKFREFQQRGWRAEPTLEGDIVLVHDERGWRTRPADHFALAMLHAKRLEDRKNGVAGSLGPEDA